MLYFLTAVEVCYLPEPEWSGGFITLWWNYTPTGGAVKQADPLSLVEECRGSALIGREVHSVALYGIRELALAIPRIWPRHLGGPHWLIQLLRYLSNTNIVKANMTVELREGSAGGGTGRIQPAATSAIVIGLGLSHLLASFVYPTNGW